MPRGGDRGGRRPKLSETEKRRVLNCRVRPDHYEWLVSERERTNKSTGEIVDLALETLKQSPKKQFPNSQKE